MKVCVIGTGYVGLVTGACLAQAGHEVICVDNNAPKVALMQSGHSPIYEPGLSELMQLTMAANRLTFTQDLKVGVEHGEILFIAVGTPPLPTGESDTRAVESVARGIGQNLTTGYKVVVNKSTVPIGSGNWVQRLIQDELTKRSEAAAEDFDIEHCSFDVVSNPEFLREGSAIFDTFNPDRIILGSSSLQAVAHMRQLYNHIINRDFAADQTLHSVPFVVTDLASAEMIKYAANAFLATKISFINEMANICDRIGADVTQVSQGIGLDSRIGPKFLQAGIGWGGSCFPKDVSALVHTAKDYGVDTPLLNATVRANQYQRLVAVEKLQQQLKILKGKTIGLLGLTFKPNTDDLRDTPALEILTELHRMGTCVKAYDPMIQDPTVHRALEKVQLTSDVETLAIGCDALLLVTDWPEFAKLNYANLAARMQTPLLIDGRNCLDPETIRQAGMVYVGIGRRTEAANHALKLHSRLKEISKVPVQAA